MYINKKTVKASQCPSCLFTN